MSILFKPLEFIFKLIFRLFQIGCFCFFILICFFTNNLGWIVGIGTNGYLARQWQAERAMYGSHFGDDDVKAQPLRFDSLDFSGRNGGCLVIEQSYSVENCYAYPVNHKGYEYSSNDEHFLSRSKTALKRKSGRMAAALVTATESAYQLRETLELLQHRSTDAPKVISWEHFQSYLAKANSIRLNHAPLINVLYSTPHCGDVCGIYGDDMDLILGICVATNTEDCRAQATWYADNFSTRATLPSGQEEAEAKLLEMGTVDFWLTAAHENGIVGHDDEIRDANKAFNDALEARYPLFHEGGPNVNYPLDSRNYLGVE